MFYVKNGHVTLLGVPTCFLILPMNTHYEVFVRKGQGKQILVQTRVQCCPKRIKKLFMLTKTGIVRYGSRGLISVVWEQVSARVSFWLRDS